MNRERLYTYIQRVYFRILFIHNGIWRVQRANIKAGPRLLSGCTAGTPDKPRLPAMRPDFVSSCEAAGGASRPVASAKSAMWR